MPDHSKPALVEILLVEDNPGDVELTRLALRHWQIANRITVARDGVEAMALLRRGNESRPFADLILLDLNLPRMDGREVLSCVKQDPCLKRIPVVVLTSSKSDEDVLQAYDLHANCFLSKPASFTELRAVLKTVEHFWFATVSLPSRLG